MAETIHCDTHGGSAKTYVCSHLLEETAGLGFNRRKPTKKNPFPDAWCDNCELIRVAYGGWNNESEKLSKIALLCSGCYERSRIRNTRPSVTLDDLAGLRWKCGSCDEWHTGPALDFGFNEPFSWEKSYERASRWSVLPSGAIEKPGRSFLDDDYCAIDDEYFFVRGVIELPIIGTTETFCWGVWGSLSSQNFENLLRLEDDGSRAKLPPIFSWLNTRIADYPDTLSLKMYAHVQEGNMRLRFELQPSDHPLAQEYHHGISPERVREIMLRRLPAREQ